MADDKDKKIGEVPHLTEVTGKEKIPVSAEGEPRYLEVKQIREGLLTEEKADEKLAKIQGITWGRITKRLPPETVIRLSNTAVKNPYSMLSGEFGKDGTPSTNTISWIRANSHRYVGNYDAEQGMVLRQLDDNDSTKYADGSDASEDIKGTNGGDVFMKMPDFWFKGERVLPDSNQYIDMYFTAQEPEDEGWTKWDGNTLIGVYKAVAEDTENNENGALFSRSSVTPNASISYKNFKAKARNRSNGNDYFQLVTYEAHRAMAMLYMAWYGNTNSQAQCGAGTASYPKVAGDTNVDGMNDTVDENTRSINFWGLENWWGDVYEIMDNLDTNDTKGNLNIKDYIGNTIRQAYGHTVEGCIVSMSDVYGVFEMTPSYAMDQKNDPNVYFCDYSKIATTSGQIGRRSYFGSDWNCGVFCLCVNGSPSGSLAYAGSRLLYNGRVTISNTPTRMMRSLAPVWKPIDLQYVYRDGTPTLRTGFDFNICNVSTLEEVGKLSLYGLNINYDEIEFESNACKADKEGNITFNTDGMPQSIDMNYKGQLIGTLKFYDISEEELIERQREEYERQMLEQSETEQSE